MCKVRKPSRASGQESRGAAAVEFALVVPLLLTILFGIIEFGWAYAQMLDIRHGAREGARLISVNAFPPGEDAESMTAAQQTDYLVATICNRMDFADDVVVSLAFADAASVSAGAVATIRVSTDLQTVTGWFDPLLGDKVLASDLEVRLEQEAQWSAITEAPCPS